MPMQSTFVQVRSSQTLARGPSGAGEEFEGGPNIQ